MVNLMKVDFVEEVVAHGDRILLGITQRLQVVVLINADRDRPVLSHARCLMLFLQLQPSRSFSLNAIGCEQSLSLSVAAERN